MAVTNSGMTAEYWLVGSWRGPNTLKYRIVTVSNPKTASECDREDGEDDEVGKRRFTHDLY